MESKGGGKMSDITEKDGIKAIQFLQGVMNIEETEEQARAGWNGMSESEKVTTMQAYQVMKPKNE